MKLRLAGVMMLVALCTAATAAQAKRITVDLNSSKLHNVTVMDSSGFVLDIVIPEELKGKELFGAYLEMYFDVDADAVDGFVNDTPRLDIFALTSNARGEVGEQAIGAPAFGAPNVARGENRKVVRDITQIVRNYLSNASSNHGLVLGSITGNRDGVFTVRSGVLGQGTVARLIFHYRG